MPDVNHPYAASMNELYPYKVDLQNCEDEPLHHISVVQPQTCVLGVNTDTQVVTHVSENSEDILGKPYDEVLERTLSEILPAAVLSQVQRGLKRKSFEGINPIRTNFTSPQGLIPKNTIVHFLDESMVIEIEPVVEAFSAFEYQKQLGRTIQRIQSFTNYATMFASTTEAVRKITGFDRVMIYQFDEDNHGEVIAEARREDLEPFLGLRYPSSDIPQQARDLYLQNSVRLLADVQGMPARLIASPALKGEHRYLDLSCCTARGVSPIHQEYLYNMGVTATMSIAINLNGKLWGLFALHHGTVRFVDYQLRMFLQFLGQVFSGHLALQAASHYRERVLELTTKRSQLTSRLEGSSDIVAGLLDQADLSLLDVIDDCQGVALGLEDKIHVRGVTPEASQLSKFVQHVYENHTDELLHVEDCIQKSYNNSDELEKQIAGVLLVWLDRKRGEFIAWFRVETVRTITWGGKPTKRSEGGDKAHHRLSPRGSFSKYVEEIVGHCEPWTQLNEDTALAFRAHFKDVVMERYHIVRQVNTELQAAYQEMETYSYTISHDLRAPLRAIRGFAEIITEDYGKELDQEALSLLEGIVVNTERMNTFISELLELSRIGSSALTRETIAINQLAQKIYTEQKASYPDADVTFEVADDIPDASADPQLLWVILSNFISNSLKYRRDEADLKIELGWVPSSDSDEDSAVTYYVRDNGQGFDQRYVVKVFEMFSRLNTDPHISGHGVGLALVQRAIEKHGGTLSAEGKLGEGASFYFTLAPSQKK